MLKAGLTAFITMIAILDPLGNVPTFLALSRSLDEPLRRRAASQAVLTALAIIFGFALVGRLLLRYLGVSLASLSVAGGLLLALVALDMLRGRYDDPQITERANIALVPLGTPLIAGPGAIAATMVLTERNHGFAARGGVWLGIALALGVTWLVLTLASPISRRMATSFIHLLSRIVALLLSALAVELVLTGLHAWLRAHP